MKRVSLGKKRPCRICKRWFMAHARVKDRQMTCGAAECKREWHRRRCAQWNRDNPEYFRANYLQKKLDGAASRNQGPKALRGENQPNTPLKSRLKSGLPLGQVQEVIGIEHLIIIEYFGQLLFRRFQEAIRRQLIVNTKQLSQQSRMMSSRCDRL
jgi:hypothetical protein